MRKFQAKIFLIISTRFSSFVFGGSFDEFLSTSGTGTSPKSTHFRHIPTTQKREIINKTDGKYTYIDCNRPGDDFYHREHFMNSKNPRTSFFSFTNYYARKK